MFFRILKNSKPIFFLLLVSLFSCHSNEDLYERVGFEPGGRPNVASQPKAYEPSQNSYYPQTIQNGQPVIVIYRDYYYRHQPAPRDYDPQATSRFYSNPYTIDNPQYYGASPDSERDYKIPSNYQNIEKEHHPPIDMHE